MLGLNMYRNRRLARFVGDVFTRTPLVKMILLLAALWMGFATALFISESGAEDATIVTFGDALYWGVAAFSTAGIADAPTSQIAKAIGGLWIIVGSMLYFGTIVATVTAYFMRPLLRPGRQIIETIEYNLEQLDDLNVEELDLLKDTIDALIVHVERVKQTQAG